jgi:hypothetical protein
MELQATIDDLCRSAVRSDGAAVLPLAATLLVFFPVTRAYFLGDDFLHLVEVANDDLGTVLWRPYMSHLYVVPTALYWFLWRVFGLDPRPFYWTLLLVHLANVALFFRVVRHLTGSPRLASVGALLWGTYPYHEGSLAWFCVHGNVLVGSAFLIAINGLASHEEANRKVGGLAAAWWATLLLVACTCFGTGLGIAVAFPLLALLWLPSLLTRPARAILLLLPVVAVAAYAGVHYVYPQSPGPRPELALRALTQNPLTPALAVAHLLTFGLSSLCAGLFWYPLSYPSWQAYALAAAVLICVLFAASGRRRCVFALLLAATAAYAVVSLGRGNLFAMLSSLTPAAVATISRYHYVSSIALALAVCLAAARSKTSMHLNDTTGRLLTLGSTMVVLAAFARSGWTIDLHSESRYAVRAVLAEATAAAQTVPKGGVAQVRDRWFRSKYIWTNVVTASGIFSLYHPTNELNGRQIVYVQDDSSFQELTILPGSPLARLVVRGASPQRPGLASENVLRGAP